MRGLLLIVPAAFLLARLLGICGVVVVSGNGGPGISAGVDNLLCIQTKECILIETERSTAMQWTEAQDYTIGSRGKNILVSAAAGSGKTAVLIERIKQLILQDKVDVDRFLITTFTNAASQEMRERLEQAIRKEMDQPDADRAFLKRQLDLMYKANIGTFHNFALEVMHRYFYLTELEPGFVIGDEIQVSILKKGKRGCSFETRFEEDFDRFKAFLRKIQRRPEREPAERQYDQLIR